MRMKHTVGNIYKTNLDGDVELISKNGKVATVRFLNTGFEREVAMANLTAGKCRDYTITERVYSETTYPYELIESNSSGPFIVLEKTSKGCIVQFIETGYTKKALWENAKIGKVGDPYSTSVHGHGYLGEYEHLPYWKQAKQLWQNMLKRCYCASDPRGYYGKGVSVETRWLCFANFLEDISSIENFELWLTGQKDSLEKYNLDKDYLYKDNKVYSKETCIFLPESLNKSMTSRTNKWAGHYESCLRLNAS